MCICHALNHRSCYEIHMLKIERLLNFMFLTPTPGGPVAVPKAPEVPVPKAPEVPVPKASVPAEVEES